MAVPWLFLTASDVAVPEVVVGLSFWVNASSVTFNVMACQATVHRHSSAANTPRKALGLVINFPPVQYHAPWPLATPVRASQVIRTPGVLRRLALDIPVM